MFRAKYRLAVAPDEAAELRRIANSATSEVRLVRRAKAVLDLATGHSVAAAAASSGLSEQSVCTWRKRYCEAGLAGLADLKRSGRKPRIPAARLDEIARAAVNGQGRPSLRKVGRRLGVSKSTVQRVWRQHDLKPHLRRTFKLSNDPAFESKFWDIIGLYLDPPDKAMILCCDEKSQCQALERTQPGLPLGVGHIRTQTHDYYRHGTMTLFAALDYLSGRIISRTDTRHRHVEWLSFLRQIHREVPKELQVHIILDNYSTHKHAAVRKWLASHPRFHLHFTPTSASWMNLVERFFRDISEDVIRAGSFTSVRELAEAILQYLAERNTAPTRYVWHADGHEILEKITRARQRLRALANIKETSETPH